MFVDPPEKTYGKTIHETTSLSCDDPKRIGISHLQHPCDADDAKRLQTAHTCHLMTAVSARRPAAVISQEGKKWREKQKASRSDGNLKMIGFQNRQKTYQYIQQGVVFLKPKGVEESGTPFPMWHPFFQGPGRGMFIRRSKNDHKSKWNQQRNRINCAKQSEPTKKKHESSL